MKDTINEGGARIINMAVASKKITQKELAERCGMPTQSLYNMLGRNTLTVKSLQTLADAIGCDVVLKDRETGKIYE